jgi:adenylate kinase family enzyme
VRLVPNGDPIRRRVLCDDRGASDRGGAVVRRVHVVGTSGSGKSTLSRRLAAHLGAPWIQLDALFHQPGWTPLPEAEFRSEVARRIAAESWVVDGNYSVVRDLVDARADTVVWLDLPRPVVMRQIVGRTLRRLVTGAELWNGNRERWRNLCSLDPHESVIVWSWTTHGPIRDRMEAACATPEFARLTVVRLRTRREVERFAARLG